MKKQMKFVAALSAAALLTFGAAMTSMAATGWNQEDGTWVYYDSEGYRITDSWRKSGNFWYYLDSDGYMATEQKIDNYYVNEDGVMVTNAWIEVANDSDWDSPEAPESFWYYFDKDGKMISDKWKEINNFWYHFDSEGQMETGKVSIGDGTYYLGSDNDGTMKTGWVQLEDEDSDGPEDSDSWYFFDNSGKMVEDHVDKKINGKYYTFKEGKMQTGWVDVNAADDGTVVGGYKYYGAENDGARADGWRKIEGVDGVSDESKEFWFFFKNGKAHHATHGVQALNVNGKKYAFNTNGEMQHGLQDIEIASNSEAIYYFGKEDDGAMKTGKQSIYDEDLDETNVWYFYTDGSKKGQGYHGIKDNNIYLHGQRQDADSDMRYAPAEYDNERYLVNTSGAIQKAGNSSKSSQNSTLGAGHKDFKDNNGDIWTVNTKGIIKSTTADK